MRYINIQKKRPTSKLLLGRPLITVALVMIYKRESGMGYSIGKFSSYMEGGGRQDRVVRLMATLQDESLGLLVYEDMRQRTEIS